MTANTELVRQLHREIKDSKDLRSRIRELAEGEPDPGVVTEKLLAEMTRAEMMVLARAASRNYVRSVIQHSLGGHRPLPDQLIPSQRNVDSSSESSGVGRNPSRKWAAVQDWIAQRLQERVYVESLDEWKFLGKCSVTDLLSSIEKGRRDIGDLQATVDRKAKYVEAMQTAGVDLMEDLPRDALEKVLVK